MFFVELNIVNIHLTNMLAFYFIKYKLYFGFHLFSYKNFSQAEFTLLIS